MVPISHCTEPSCKKLPSFYTETHRLGKLNETKEERWGHQEAEQDQSCTEGDGCWEAWGPLWGLYKEPLGNHLRLYLSLQRCPGTLCCALRAPAGGGDPTEPDGQGE